MCLCRSLQFIVRAADFLRFMLKCFICESFLLKNTDLKMNFLSQIASPSRANAKIERVFFTGVNTVISCFFLGQ